MNGKEHHVLRALLELEQLRRDFGAVTHNEVAKHAGIGPYMACSILSNLGFFVEVVGYTPRNTHGHSNRIYKLTAIGVKYAQSSFRSVTSKRTPVGMTPLP
jgi:hypothetical protein